MSISSVRVLLLVGHPNLSLARDKGVKGKEGNS